jgi:hypothetical protein
MQREMDSLRALATRPNTDTSGQNAVSAVNAHLETRVAVLENDSRMSVEHFGQLAAFVNDEVRCWHDAQTVDRIDFTQTEISGDCKLEMQQHIELFHSEPYSGSDPGDWQDTAHAPETPLQQIPIALSSLAAERGWRVFHDIVEEGEGSKRDRTPRLVLPASFCPPPGCPSRTTTPQPRYVGSLGGGSDQPQEKVLKTPLRDFFSCDQSQAPRPTGGRQLRTPLGEGFSAHISMIRADRVERGSHRQGLACTRWLRKSSGIPPNPTFLA